MARLETSPEDARRALDERLLSWFTYHPPDTQEKIEAYQHIREAGLAFARVVAEFTPISADQTVALRAIREAVMWANAAVALEGK